MKLNRPLVVGINGAYTSGKTVFADGLAQHMRLAGYKVQLIHYDHFHRPFQEITWTDTTQVDAFCNRAFDPDRLIRELLAPLKANGHVSKEVPCIDLGTGRYHPVRFEIDRETIVLLEGVLLYRPPLTDFLDYKVYLDIGYDEMLRRAQKRDVPRFGAHMLGLFETRYIPVQKAYVAEWSPMAHSDLVIDNNDYDHPRIMADQSREET